MPTEQRVLCFLCGNNGYAVPIQLVKEVLAPMKLTHTPGTPPYYKGLANIRGEMISVWDSRVFFGIEANTDLQTSGHEEGAKGAKVAEGANGAKHPENTEHAVIVLECENKKLGIYVDTVESVQKPLASQLSAPPAELQVSQASQVFTGQGINSQGIQGQGLGQQSLLAAPKSTAQIASVFQKGTDMYLVLNVMETFFAHFERTAA